MAGGRRVKPGLEQAGEHIGRVASIVPAVKMRRWRQLGKRPVVGTARYLALRKKLGLLRVGCLEDGLFAFVAFG
jgi:hypothetical protein